MRFRSTIWISLVLALPIPAADPLRAGTAVANISPPVGGPMWGYAARHDAACTGILDPLKARALVMSTEVERMAIVSLDLGRAPPRDVTARIREKLAADGVKHLFLVASHTHHGPVLELADWPDPKKPYLLDLEQKLIDVVRQADKCSRPARFGIASRELPLNRNRHSKLAERPVDKELRVLRLEDDGGAVIAHLVNFAAHPTMLDAKLLKFSADYPGAMAEFVEKETGAPCLFLQGASGDLSPNPPPSSRGHDAFGKLLGKEVVDLTKTIRVGEQQAHSIQGTTEIFRFRATLDVGNPLVKAGLSAAFFPAQIAFYEREYRDGVRPELNVALLDGRVGFVGVSGEFFCGHAIHLKKRARLDHLFFLGYCNDYQQYFPTIEALAEGGSGASPPVATAEPGAGEKMMDRALILLYQMRGKLPQ